MSPQPWTIRAVQLDLGRQMETLDYIRGFIDFATQFGYNSLHLYLEGRVRTPSFPYPPKAFSYSLDEMREVVEYATSKGMDVVPQINCFSHVEHFLKYPELSHLAELREGGKGRFGGTNKYVYCPSLEETYAFLETYLAEVASAFPSPHFAVGLDEVWDMGLCSACKARLAAGETLDDLFAKHIQRLHRIVSGKLGKRMWMWDDMLEEFPRALDQIPTDIVQIVWQYGNLVDRCHTHFGRVRSDFRLAEFQRRGIDFLIGPAPWSSGNAGSFTTHAAPYGPLGGLMTVWELSKSFLLETYPNLAFAGRLWSDPDCIDQESLFKTSAAELFGIADPLFLHAVYAQQSRGRAGGGGLLNMLRGPITPSERDSDAESRLIAGVLTPWAGKADGVLANAVLDDILLRLRREDVLDGQRELVEQVYATWAGEADIEVGDLIEDATSLAAEIATIRDHRARQWAQWRPGLEHENGVAIDDPWYREAADLITRIGTPGRKVSLLTVGYALPDYYGSQRIVWEAQFADGEEWVKIFEGGPKPRGGVPDEVPFYTLRHPFEGDRLPVRLRVDSHGYGGIGIAWLEVHGHGQRLVPVKVGNVHGKVDRAEAVLRHDTFWCKLGEEDTIRAMHEPELAAVRCGMTIALGQPKPYGAL